MSSHGSDLDLANTVGRGRSVRTLAPNRRHTPGERLRAVRLVLDLSLRDVYHFSVRLSRKLRNPEFVLPPSRLHEFETRNVIPGVHKLYTLACAYEYAMAEFLDWYGIPKVRTSKHPHPERRLWSKLVRDLKHSGS